MKAVQITAYGDPDVLVMNEVSEPKPSEGQILVSVKAVGINPFDGKLRQGAMQKMIPLTLPVTAGGDFSGVVSDVGRGITEYKTGDQLYGTGIILAGGSGSLAEFVTVKAGTVAVKPKNIDFTGAASLPLVGSSAVQALTEHIHLARGQKILIHGGAGGIGSFAIQLAKSLGAYVVTTVSENDRDFVTSLGADAIIDFKKDAFEKKLSDMDAVYDTVGGDITVKSMGILKKGGILVTMAGKPDDQLAKQYGITVIAQGTKTNTAHLDAVRELIETGIVKPQIARIFPISQVREAFRFLETGHPQGKVVVSVT